MKCPFAFHDELRQVICEVCGLAVPPNRLNEHLRRVKAHGEAPSTVRSEWIGEHARREASKPETAARQPDGRDEIVALRTVECFQCRNCVSRFSSSKTLRRHRTREHGVREAAGRRRKSTGAERSDGRLWMQSVFGPSSPHHQYFTVRKLATAGGASVRRAPPVDVPGDETTYVGVSELFVRAAERREAERARVTVTGSKEARTPWMNTTGWLEHLKGLDLKQLVTASVLPGRRTTENDLVSICAAVREVFDEATADLAGAGRDLRQWWRSPKADEFSHRPMEALRSTAGFGRYVGYWQRLIVYCLRVRELPGPERLERHRIDFDDETGDLLEWLGRLARAPAASESKLRERNQLLKSHVFVLSATILKRKFLDSGWENPLVHFTAVLGVDESTFRLKEPEDYTSVLAGLIYCSRLILFKDCSDGLAKNLATGETAAATRTELVDSTIDHFQRYRRTYLINGSYTPVSLMLNNLAYGLKKSTLVPGQARVLWVDPERTELKYEGRSITAGGLRTMVRDLLREATDLLWQDLLFTDDDGQRFAPALKNVDDNIALGARGHSGAFLNLDRATELSAGVELVQNRLFRNAGAKKRMLTSTSTFKNSGLKAYGHSTERFLDRLFVLVHVTGGAPARGTEISCTRYRDGPSVDRNLFTIGGRVILISQYHKGMVITDRLKVVPRVLPRAVGELVALYLRYARPFTDALDAIHDGSKPETDYLWETGKGDCWGSNRMARAMGEATEGSLGVRLTVRSYRHVAVAFSRDVVHRGRPAAEQFKDFRSEDPLLEEAEEADGYDPQQATAAQQTGHGIRQRFNHYGQAANLTSKLTSNSLELFTRVSEEWHRFLGLNDEENGCGHRKPQAGDKKHRRQESSADLQNNTQPDFISKPPAAKKQRSFADLKEVRMKISKNIHAYGFESPHRVAHALLKSTFGHDGFKSPEQLEGVISVLEKRPLTTVVLPTGGGKSLLWMLPAAADERGTTAVVVPYISLADDIIKRCGEAGLKADYWRSDHQPQRSRIIVTVTESAMGSIQHDFNKHQTFLQYLSVLKINGCLNRIVIDECHTVVTEGGFRSAMGQVFHLRSLDVPMLFTTATLPPRMREDFEEALALTESPVRYVRAQSLRTNISVNVMRCGNGRAVTAALKLARELKEKSNPGQKIVIYTRFKNEAESLAGPKMLDCRFYHGEMDEGARLSALEEWQKPEQTFLTATTAFGCGVDHPGIIETIHVGLPYSLINYVQESGRAARRSERGRSTIVTEDREWQAADDGRTLNTTQFSEYDAAYLRWTVSTGGCRLIPMSRYLNGSDGENCDELSANPCDNCRKAKGKGGESEGHLAVRAKTRSEKKGKDLIVETLEWLNGGCTACLLRGARDADGHKLSGCDREPGFDFNAVVDFSRSIKWPGNWGYCWTCGLPEEICSEASKSRDERKTCAYKWVIAAVALHGRSEGSEFGLRTKRFISVSDWSKFDYGGWLGRKRPNRLYGIRATQAFAILDLFSKEFF